MDTKSTMDDAGAPLSARMPSKSASLHLNHAATRIMHRNMVV